MVRLPTKPKKDNRGSSVRSWQDGNLQGDDY
jgi:hypothetical protein